MENIEFTDRYGGGPRPDPETMCKGQCEGFGVYPQHEESLDTTPYEASEILRIQNESGPSKDGYYFVRCEECNGTGKRPDATQ